MQCRQFESSYHYCPPDMIDVEEAQGIRPGRWRNNQVSDGLLSIRDGLGSNNYSRNAKYVRKKFKNFFSEGKGQVPWQMQYVTSVENCFDAQI